MLAITTRVLGAVVFSTAISALSTIDCKADDERCGFCFHWDSDQDACLLDEACRRAAEGEGGGGGTCGYHLICSCEDGESPGGNGCSPCSEVSRERVCRRY